MCCAASHTLLMAICIIKNNDSSFILISYSKNKTPTKLAMSSTLTFSFSLYIFIVGTFHFYI